MAGDRETYMFEIYVDFVINDLNNTLYFKTGTERDAYFAGIDPTRVKKFQREFNHIRDRQSIVVSDRVEGGYISYKTISTCTYGRFYMPGDSPFYYYFNIIDTEYETGQSTRINFLIDPFVTYMYYDLAWDRRYNTQIQRQHLIREDYDKYIKYLTHNNDILFSGTNVYNIHQKVSRFSPTDDYWIMILSSVRLEGGYSSFTDQNDNPLMPTPEGNTHDKVSSPASLYMMRESEFYAFMGTLKDYSWIVQNFIRINLIPSSFVQDNNLELLMANYQQAIYRFKRNTRTVDFDISDLNFTWDQIAEIFKIDLQRERHLLRYPYCYIEATAWNGQSINIRLEDINNDSGLQMHMILCIGYRNEVAIYPKLHNSLDENNYGGMETRGDFLNNAIIINQFDEIPVLIDNYGLYIANNANRRDLAEERLISARASNVLDKDADLRSRIYDTVNIISNFSLTSLGNKINDEYEFYRDQTAEFNDAKLTMPTITQQSPVNNLAINNNYYGVTLKFKSIPPETMDIVRQYHKNFGFETPFIQNKITPNAMTKCTYVKAKVNNFKLRNADGRLSELVKLRLENGVRIWNSENINWASESVTQNLTDNEMRI